MTALDTTEMTKEEALHITNLEHRANSLDQRAKSMAGSTADLVDKLVHEVDHQLHSAANKRVVSWVGFSIGGGG